MAQYQHQVFLGYQDTLITEKYNDVYHNTNKIGGKPNWPTSNDVPISPCPLCNFPRLLVVQINAPLENSSYDRTLYLFACINSSCWNKNESWLCVRSQKFVENPVEKCSPTQNFSKGATNWCQDADDWDDVNMNEENGNLVKSFQGDAQTDDEDDSNSFGELRGDFGNLVIGDQDANCNAAVEEIQGGAVGRQLSPVATAEIEGDEGEDVTAESPLSPQQNLIALLHNAQPLPQELYHRIHSNSSKNTALQFTPYFMNVCEEILQESSHGIPEHRIRELLQEYQQNNEDGDRKKISNCDNVLSECDEGVSEKYEKAVPMHGDRMFHHFISRIQMNPGQILRYNRGSTPLLPYIPPEVPKKCKHCHGDLVFEFQILSTLISKLHLQDIESNEAFIEFGTVLVFTCKNSCWSTEKLTQEEEIILLSEKF